MRLSRDNPDRSLELELNNRERVFERALASERDPRVLMCRVFGLLITYYSPVDRTVTDARIARLEGTLDE